MSIIIFQKNNKFILNDVVEYNYIAKLKKLYLKFKEVSVIIDGVDYIEEV